MPDVELPSWAVRLLRPLAGDDHRAHFWVSHVRLGVVLSELAALVVVVYVAAVQRPEGRALTVLAAITMVTAPLVLLLPMHRWCRDHRGALLFYLWSALTTGFICTAIVIDGGAASPLAWLLTLTLTYAGLAYPPAGVAIMGLLMIAGYLVAAASGPGMSSDSGVTASVLALFTVMIAWASRNQWEMVDQQVLLTQRLATLADTDELTGCVNRRAFTVRLEEALGSAGEGSPVSLCVLDLDGFKRVNDTEGHAAGDRVLAAAARSLRRAARETDTVSRLGGDEFAVLLPGTPGRWAAALGQRLRQELSVEIGSDRVTASMGIVTVTEPQAGDAVMAAADRLMYDAKNAGRDRIAQAGR